MANSGNWSQLKTLRKGNFISKGCLQNLTNEVIPSNKQAETLAEYFEKIQWKIRPTRLHEGSNNFPTLFEELLLNIMISQCMSSVNLRRN